MIKRFTLLLLILFTLGVSLHAQPESLMQQMIAADKANNANMFYNLGVDFYASGEHGYANLYWLKALNLNSAHSHARANLELSQRLSPDYALYPPRAFLVRLIYQFLHFFSVNRLAVLSLILLFLSGLALAWLLFYDPDKERALPIMVLSLLLILLGSDFTALGIKYYRQKHNDQAVVIASRTTLFDTGGKRDVLEIHSGLVLKLLSKDKEQWLVRLPNGQAGKVNAADIKKV